VIASQAIWRQQLDGIVMVKFWLDDDFSSAERDDFRWNLVGERHSVDRLTPRTLQPLPNSGFNHFPLGSTKAHSVRKNTIRVKCRDSRRTIGTIFEGTVELPSIGKLSMMPR
jgi:hypothetical protein